MVVFDFSITSLHCISNVQTQKLSTCCSRAEPFRRSVQSEIQKLMELRSHIKLHTDNMRMVEGRTYMYPLQYSSGESNVKSNETEHRNLCVPHNTSITNTIRRMIKTNAQSDMYQNYLNLPSNLQLVCVIQVSIGC